MPNTQFCLLHRELDLLRPLITEYQSSQNLINAQTLELGELEQLREDLFKARNRYVELAPQLEARSRS